MRRQQLWLLAASGPLASATWIGQPLQRPRGESLHLVPRATQASTPDEVNGWTPKPTEGPSLELLARRRQEWIKVKRQTSNPWLDDTTCGWRADIESEPWTCSFSQTCTTNTDKVVGCFSSGGPDPFFTVCLDYRAVQAGACDNVGDKTGCCVDSTVGECVTYLWPGPTVRSMYMCHTERAVITLLSTPYIVDLGTSSTSSDSSSSGTSSTSTSSTTSTGLLPNPQSSDTQQPTTSNGGGTNIGAIVGGAVGGVAVLALIVAAIAFFLIRSRKKEQLGAAGAGYSAVAPGDTGYPASTVSPQMSHAGAGGYFSPGSVGTTMQPGTPYLDPNAPAAPGAYDTRTSYYDPSKPADQQGYGQYPGGLHQVPELDSTSTAPGHRNNPAEMAAEPAAAELR